MISGKIRESADTEDGTLEVRGNRKKGDLRMKSLGQPGGEVNCSANNPDKECLNKCWEGVEVSSIRYSQG